MRSFTNAICLNRAALQLASTVTCCVLQTLESTWERPESLAWRTATAPDHDNRVYYVNDRSKESVWEKPAPLAWQRQLFVAHDASGL